MRTTALALLFLSACSACSGQTLTPAQVQGVNEGVCALEHYATDPACRQPATFATCISDAASACGITVESVQAVFASHKKATVADGVVPAPVATDAGR